MLHPLQEFKLKAICAAILTFAPFLAQAITSTGGPATGGNGGNGADSSADAGFYLPITIPITPPMLQPVPAAAVAQAQTPLLVMPATAAMAAMAVMQCNSRDPSRVSKRLAEAYATGGDGGAGGAGGNAVNLPFGYIFNSGAGGNGGNGDQWRHCKCDRHYRGLQ